MQSLMMREAGARPFFPSIERVAIERVACTEPGAYGLEITRWDCRTLQQIVIDEAIVGSIHYTTVARILADASLQPHRSRYWKTATIDSEFMRRAAQVLWCYENVERLHERGDAVICVDEKPNIQALERCARTKPLCSGQITRREFEYKRHGTVNLLVALNVYTGSMWACCLDKNDHQHFLWALRQISRRNARAQRIHLIMDNGSSHIDHHTRSYLRNHERYRPLYTPAHASWLNQAELLLRAFTDKYLKHFEASSRQELIDHLNASWPEYNERFAHPFRWSWTRRQLHDWAAKKQPVSICIQTYATVH
jgi:DDE superfamily endonuclease